MQGQPTASNESINYCYREHYQGWKSEICCIIGSVVSVDSVSSKGRDYLSTSRTLEARARGA